MEPTPPLPVAAAPPLMSKGSVSSQAIRRVMMGLQVMHPR